MLNITQEVNDEIPYIIVCDESTKKGNNYSFFFGGAMIQEKYYNDINDKLRTFRDSLGLKEIKRSNIDETNAERYIKVLDYFFEFVYENKINVRVMFSDNEYLNKRAFSRNDITFNKFYYFFIRYAFNLFYLPTNIKLRIIFDELPDKKSVNDNFKNHLINHLSAETVPHQLSTVKINNESIHEVDSKKHLILQCCDVIMGLIDFFLNEYISKNYLDSKRSRGRAIVLERLLTHIYRSDPNFNLLITTPYLLGTKGCLIKYAHYLYKPKSRKLKKSLGFSYGLKK